MLKTLESTSHLFKFTSICLRKLCSASEIPIECSVLISNIISDSGNAAFVLNDRRKQLSEKARFLIKQRWFYGLILLVLLIIAFINTLVIVLSANKSNTIIIVVDRDKWGADPPKEGLTNFQLPIKRIILTHTADEEESCGTQVCL